MKPSRFLIAGLTLSFFSIISLRAKGDANSVNAPSPLLEKVVPASPQPVTKVSSEMAAVLAAPADVEVRFPVEKYKLDNGLTVLLAEDHSAPLVSYNTWFKVGSRDEEPGTTGIAHLFEHMMFKGAKRYQSGDYDKALTSAGGTNNAFTTRDYTGYYIILPSLKVELAIDLESDRMESLQITEENLKSELEVVKEERRYRVDTDVVGQLFERIFASVYKVHPYRWPVIGWMQDLEHMNVEKCRAFFSKFYAPNNAVIVVSGDFKPSEIKPLIQKYYGGIKSHIVQRHSQVNEPVQREERKVKFSETSQNEYVAVVYPAPAAGKDDSYTLDLLGSILAGGHSSRLYQRLVYQARVAEAVGADDNGLLESGLFHVMTTLRKGASNKRALSIIDSEISNAKTKLYSPQELQRAKNQVMKGYVDSLKTIHGKAQVLAVNETVLGSYDRLFSDLKKYEAVTPEMIRKAANDYLKPTQRTTVILEPKAPGKKVSQKGGGQ